LTRELANIDVAFVNTNGFAIGEKAEIYWGIHIYELAAGAGVKHYVWATIDYSSKLGHFKPEFRCGHADGKGKVSEFIAAQPTSTLPWTILHSGPYMETLSEMLRPKPVKGDDGETWVFAAPLGDGALPLIVLEDLGWYARWIFDHPERSVGMWLKASTEHVHWADLASTFTAVTGKRAVYKNLTLDEYFASGVFPNAEAKVGHGVGDDSTLQTYRQNFTGFWNMWKASGGNKGNAQRDYALLDEIYPGRIKSVEEWMRKTGYTGEPGSVLKDYRDSKGRSPSARGMDK
jgi:hypothetical protein